MTTIQIRIDDKIKEEAKVILDDVGLDLSTAIKLYLRQVALVKGIPFRILTENGMTIEQEVTVLKASREAKRGVNVTKPMDADTAVTFLRNRRLKSAKKSHK